MKIGKIGRIITLLIVFAMAMTPLVGAADAPDESELKETAIVFPASGGVSSTDQAGSGESFNGYIYSGQGAAFLSAKYLKITYTVTGEVGENVNLFTFQPFDSEWGGWQNNFVTIADSIKSGDSYTAYVSVDDVKASLGEGVAAMGINISFMEPPAGVVVKLISYSTLSEPTGLPEDARGWLEYSINYCKALDPAKYQDASFKTFQSAITTAEGVLNNSSATNSQLQTARDNLETAKAKLLFVNSTDAGNPLPFRTLSGQETVAEMGVGWNLGNTMDGHSGGHPSETSWQPYTTTKEMIRALHDAGFNTIRIPVTWGDMIDDDNGYAINDGWISRVQDIVDYCVEQDMYAIINIHHDGVVATGGWLAVGSDNIDYVYEKFENTWRNIAERFKDYDEHLIFEAFNELTCDESDSGKNSADAQKKDTPIIMNLNQIFVNTVRATGSNNTKRWLGALTHYAARGTSYNFALPSDSYNSDNRLMFSQHIYKDSSKDNYIWDASQSTDTTGRANETVKVVKEAHNKFKNVPIILGEYGYRNKKNSANPSGYNDIGRAYVYECVTRASQVGMTVPVTWDDSRGSGQPLFETGVYTVWDRESGKPVFKTITDAMMRGMFLTPSSKNKSFDMSDIVSNPTVTPITEITPSASEVKIEVGGSEKLTSSVQPSNSNDVVLWKTDDDGVATVYNGLIQGKSIGTTYVTAFSQSGSTEVKIKVTVAPKQSESPASAINAPEGITVAQGSYDYIEASADNGERLLYESTNENIASVNPSGKIVAKNVGSAYIIVTAESGIAKAVPVTVTEKPGEKKVNVAANIYYTQSYSGTERGKPVAITGDGQYTVSYDLKTDISDNAKKAGLSEINGFGSLYIKDYDADVNGASQSPIEGCDIRYDEIKLNGVPLNITNSEFKSAMNGAVLDTGDPFNAWTGSVSDNVTVDTKKYIINFKPMKADAIDSVQAISEGGKVTGVEANVNYLPDTENVTAVAAVYDQDGKLTSADSRSLPVGDISVGKTVFDGFDLTVPDGGEAKAFVWSDLDGMVPVSVSGTSENITPTRIDITFTIRNLKFKETKKGTPAESITAADKNISIKAGESKDLTVSVAPVGTTSLVSFVSSDNGVVIADGAKTKSVNADGSCTVSVVGVKAGTATVTAITDNGFSETFEVSVSE